MSNRELTLRMIASVQTLLLTFGANEWPTVNAKLTRIETYLIRRFNR